MKIGVIGNGFVGKATNILSCRGVNILSYDLDPLLCQPVGTTLDDVCQTDIIFISVPTPMTISGECSLKYIDSVVLELSQRVNFNEKLVVIRSTVPPGTSDRLNCYFMPEFLTEKNYHHDFVHNENWIFGLKNNTQNNTQNNTFKAVVTELINTSFRYGKIKHSTIHFLLNSEAEMVKMFRNNFLALKVSFCNEIEEFCRKKGVDYDNVRDIAVLDSRIGSNHTRVPGHDGRRGYGGTCFPKDSNSLLFEMNRHDMTSYIVKAMVERNENVDRVDRDWENNKGRAVE